MILSNINKFSSSELGMPKERPRFWGAIGSAAGSLIGGIFGSSNNSSTNDANLEATRETNQANLDIARMNNEYNAQQFDKQIQYNWDMFNAQNEYNSASAQRKRLEAAGLNPNLMMSGGSAGTAQSQGGVTPPSASPVTMQAPHFDAYDAAPYISKMGQDALNALVAQSQIDKTNAETERQNIENSYLSNMMAAQYANLLADTSSKEQRTKYDKYLTDFGIETFNADARKHQYESLGSDLQNMYTQAQTNLIRLQSDSVSKDLKWMDARMKSELALNAAQIFAAYASGQLSKKQADLAVQQSLETQARTFGIKISNRQAEKVSSFFIEEQKWKAGSARNHYFDTEQFGSDTTRQINAYMNLISKFNPLRFVFGR